MSDYCQSPAPGFTFEAVRRAIVQEIQEGSGESVSEFHRFRPNPIVRTLKPISNRFNQALASYDATKEEKVDALKKRNLAIEESLKEEKQ
jgi:hypothetical protein